MAYLSGTWRLLGTIRGQAGSADGTWYPVLTDAVGAARVVLDPVSGDPLWTWEGREAFGHAAPNPQPTANHAAFTFHARFPGQWFDPETGLHHNGFRDYDARTGRYVQSDPIGLEAGWNTYGYVGGDPVGAYDPLGLRKIVAYFWSGGTGHVMLAELDGRPILNQYPQKPVMVGLGTYIWSANNGTAERLVPFRGPPIRNQPCM